MHITRSQARMSGGDGIRSDAAMGSPEKLDSLLPEETRNRSIRENDSILNDPESFAEALEHMDLK